MKSRFNEIMHSVCCAGVALNTILIVFNLFSGFREMALFNFFSALGCWVGIFSFGGKIDGDKQ